MILAGGRQLPARRSMHKRLDEGHQNGIVPVSVVLVAGMRCERVAPHKFARRLLVRRLFFLSCHSRMRCLELDQ